MRAVYVGGVKIQLAPAQSIGRGGEAEIYTIGKGRVLKLYKQPNDPDYAANPSMQLAAKQRLVEQQTKLKAFPKGLPSEVVGPLELAFSDAKGCAVVGFTMPFMSGREVLMRYGDRQYRESGGLRVQDALHVFRNLHDLVQRVHGAKVVIGDFNDLNVLVDQAHAVCLVDADSMQFGGYFCRAFTNRYVDPLLCLPNALEMVRPHNEDSDWYALATMLMQSLLYVGPYGGVHRPKTGKRLQHDERVLKRLTVFDGDVIYPKPALHFGLLPDELLELFHKIYERDLRGVFPVQLLGDVRWTTCSNCGLGHGRNRCPNCAAVGVVKQTVVIRGNVTATSVFKTTGRILVSAVNSGRIQYLYHKDSSFRREDGEEVLAGGLDPELRFRIANERTLVGRGHQLAVIKPAGTPAVETVDMVGTLPIFDANATGYYWLQNGQIVRDGDWGSVHIADVLAQRTLFWVGEKFGFGFYQAGQIMRSFVFGASKPGLNDNVSITSLPGRIMDTTCVFSDTHAWFMVQLQFGGEIIHQCYVVDAHGGVVAQAEAKSGEDSWLGKGIRGNFAGGSSMFVAMDDGIVRVEARSGAISVSQTFPDTEPFVDALTQLHPATDGIYAVTSRTVTLIKISTTKTP